MRSTRPSERQYQELIISGVSMRGETSYMALNCMSLVTYIPILQQREAHFFNPDKANLPIGHFYSPLYGWSKCSKDFC